MKKIKLAFSLLVGMTLVLSSQSVKANPLAATVERIIDGDTIVLNQGGTSRISQLACIETPDWIAGQAQSSPQSQSAKDRLTALIPVGSTIQYYNLGSIAEGRTLVVIFNQNRNINLQMVTEGQAQLHPRYRQTCTNSADTLAAAQSSAQAQRRGMWNR